MWVTNPEFLLTDKKNWEETGNIGTFLPLTNMEVSWTCLTVIKKFGCEKKISLWGRF